MPTDKHSAKEMMKTFSEMAYVAPYKDYFEKAIHILYGEDFIVKMDLSQRMLFSCKLCSKDMNSEIALAQHSHSGSHQKNLDKKNREQKSISYHRDVKYHHTDSSYGNPNSLQHMLKISQVKPVGLQMIEQYEKIPGSWSYYKCNLCGAHGKLEAIYRHTVGSRHTEKYIKSRVVLKNSFLTTREREVIREFLVKKEGISVSSIKTYRDERLYPKKWEKYDPGASSQKKGESQWRSPSRSPSRSRPSCSSSPDRSSHKRPKEHSPHTMFRDMKEEFAEKRPREKSPLALFRNQSPPPPPPPLNDDKAKKVGSQQARTPLQSREAVTMQDQSTQKFDLEELMVQFNFIVKTSHLPEFDIRTKEDARAALDMMFKISSALHFIIKNSIENSAGKSQQTVDTLTYKKNLLSKIMGSIKLRMEVALVGKHGT